MGKQPASDCPFAAKEQDATLTADAMKACRWLKPKLVAQLEFTEWRCPNPPEDRFLPQNDTCKSPFGLITRRICSSFIGSTPINNE